MDKPTSPDFFRNIASTNSAEELIGKYAIVCEALQIAARLYLISANMENPSPEETGEQVDTWLRESQQKLMLVFAPTPDQKN